MVQKYKETGSLASRRKNGGRKKKLTPRDLRMLEISVRRSPTKSSKSLKAELQAKGIVVGESTVRRYLKNLGLVSRFAVRKPLLTTRHKKLRLAFARKYCNQPPQFWRRVLFTDETRISTRNDSTKQRVRRKCGERLKFITPTLKYP